VSDIELLVAPPSWADIVDRRFGRLVVVGYTGNKTPYGQKRVTCRCDCGSYTHVMPKSLRSGATTSCGCRRREVTARRNVARATHGETRGGRITPEYAAWSSMLHRCGNQNNPHYSDYGGRGITVCDRWLVSVENFIADVGRKPSPAHSLDRIDNDGNYAPGNLRLASQQQQVNNRRNTVYVTYQETRILASQFPLVFHPSWTDRLIRKGFTGEQIIATAVRSVQLRRKHWRRRMLVLKRLGFMT